MNKKMTLHDLISLTEAMDDKIYLYVEIKKVNGELEKWNGMVSDFPYDWESVTIDKLEFGNWTGLNEFGLPKCSTLDLIEMTQLWDSKRK